MVEAKNNIISHYGGINYSMQTKLIGFANIFHFKRSIVIYFLIIAWRNLLAKASICEIQLIEVFIHLTVL